MKTCVFGGAFDPLHLGHENIIKTLLLKFDKVILMPSKQSPGKDLPKASSNQRMKMLSLLCLSIQNSNLIIDDYELESNQEPSFTIDSIKYIKNKLNESDELYLALGYDQFNNLSNWHNIELLLKLARIICFNRNELNKDDLSIDCEIVSNFNYDISSSKIRNLIQEDYSKVKDMVNEEIFNYIVKEKIYQ